MARDIVATETIKPFVNNQPLVTGDVILKIIVPFSLLVFFIISCTLELLPVIFSFSASKAITLL